MTHNAIKKWLAEMPAIFLIYDAIGLEKTLYYCIIEKEDFNADQCIFYA